jgi:hypothetical protein
MAGQRIEIKLIAQQNRAPANAVQAMISSGRRRISPLRGASVCIVRRMAPGPVADQPLHAGLIFRRACKPLQHLRATCEMLQKSRAALVDRA